MDCAGRDEKQVLFELVADNMICFETREPHVRTILQSHLGIWIHCLLKGFVLCTDCLDICSIRLSASWAWYVRGDLISALTSYLNLSAAPVDNCQGTILWSLFEVINTIVSSAALALYRLANKSFYTNDLGTFPSGVAWAPG